MTASTASLKTEDTVISISETVDNYFDDETVAAYDKKKLEDEEEEEEENTDCQVYIATGLLVVLCLVVVFGKVNVCKSTTLTYLT